MIDLGTVPVGHTLPDVRLDVDAIDYLVDRLSIAELPVVLDVFPRFESVDERDAVLRRGRTCLDGGGLLPDGRVHEDLHQWLRVLEQPNWYVSVRRFDGDTVPARRLCLASNDRTTVLAVREGDTLTVGVVPGDPARTLAAALGVRDSTISHAGLSTVNAPTDLLAEALDTAPADVDATARHLRTLGIADADARALASALATCTDRTEITAAVRRHGARLAAGSPIALFGTRRGRITATSSVAADGRTWSSLSTASDRTLIRALSDLIEQARQRADSRGQ